MHDTAVPSRRERRMAETRAALVAAAGELFRQKGFADTTIDEIAERADVAQRTFFRYFPTKEAVLFAEFEDLHAQLLDRLAARPADEEPLVALHHALREYAGDLQARFASLAWILKLAEEHGGLGVEKAVMRFRMTGNVADALATRLGTDPATDPRPGVWASIMLSCFGAAVRATHLDGGDVATRFDQLLAETARQLGSLPTGS